MSFKLSEGALATILAGGQVVDPVMQILGHKKIAGNSTTGLDRYRLLVSDGKHLNSFAMLATQLNDKITSGQLCDFTVVQITRFITSMVSNADKGDKRVMVILDVKILALGTEVGEKIGCPRAITDASEAETNGPSKGGPVSRPPQPHTRPIMNQSAHNASVMSSPGSTYTHPIISLSPYQNKWVIKVRVTTKSPIRTWSNARGEGKLFSMDLVDESGEIRATAFKEQCDKFYDMIEVNKVYLISKATLKTANKRYTNIKNDYEMTFTPETTVVPCDDTSDVPTMTYNFIPISNLANLETNALVDVIGVVKTVGDVQTLIARTTNRELKKRELTVVDDSNTAVSLTLWGEEAEKFDAPGTPVVAVKNARINEYAGGKSVSLLQNSNFQINPDITEAHRIRGWYDNVGASQDQSSISARSASSGGGSANLMTIREALDNRLGCGDKPDYFSCQATVLLVKHENSLYKACPSADCNKKLIDQNNGLFRCEKCNREYPNFKYRLLLSICLADFSGHQWVTCFQDVAEQILGMTSQEVGEKFLQEDEFRAIFSAAAFKTYIFKLRAKMENYNDENRLKVTIIEARPPMAVKERCEKLMSEIKEILAMGITL